ncbi:MAG TPA: hypothetical protein VF837_05365 [Patescibacteria group bacterium]
MKSNEPGLKNAFDQALENKTAFILNWKFPVEDIVFNIKGVYPSLDISSLPEKQVLGDWIEPMMLNGKEYSFKSDSPTLILDVISTVNQEILKQGNTFVWYDTQDDNYNFILISQTELPFYLEKGFKQV